MLRKKLAVLMTAELMAVMLFAVAGPASAASGCDICYQPLPGSSDAVAFT